MLFCVTSIVFACEIETKTPFEYIVQDNIYYLTDDVTDQQIEQQISEGKISFIIHSMDNAILEEYVKFEKKYGISVVIQNCVIDPISYKKTTKHNKIIYNYLNKKYGKTWLSKLVIKPFGIK